MQFLFHFVVFLVHQMPWGGQQELYYITVACIFLFLSFHRLQKKDLFSCLMSWACFADFMHAQPVSINNLLEMCVPTALCFLPDLTACFHASHEPVSLGPSSWLPWVRCCLLPFTWFSFCAFFPLLPSNQGLETQNEHLAYLRTERDSLREALASLQETGRTGEVRARQPALRLPLLVIPTPACYLSKPEYKPSVHSSLGFGRHESFLLQRCAFHVASTSQVVQASKFSQDLSQGMLPLRATLCDGGFFLPHRNMA